MTILISFIGPTGSGKSTAAAILSEQLGAPIEKVAQPLYHLQKHFYSVLGRSVEGQDGELLQFFGSKIERESPGWLAARYLEGLAGRCEEVIINDDCRLNAFRQLRGAGFRFVWVEAPASIRRERLRRDHVRADESHETEVGYSEMAYDFRIDNSGSLVQLRDQVRMVVRWLGIRERFN